MEKKFAWNMNVVYQLPHTLKLGITPSVTVPNYEAIYQSVENRLDSMTKYGDAEDVLADIKQKFDNK